MPHSGVEGGEKNNTFTLSYSSNSSVLQTGHPSKSMVLFTLTSARQVPASYLQLHIPVSHLLTEITRMNNIIYPLSALENHLFHKDSAGLPVYLYGPGMGNTANPFYLTHPRLVFVSLNLSRPQILSHLTFPSPLQAQLSPVGLDFHLNFATVPQRQKRRSRRRNSPNSQHHHHG